MLLESTARMRENIPIPVVDCPPAEFARLVLARIPAGFPSPAIDSEETPLNIHTFLISRPLATFIFAVAGDSLKNIGILDGDYLVVDRSIQERSGHIVVANVNGEFTAKRLFISDSEDIIELRPENEAYPPIRMLDGMELRIFGVVISTFRRLQTS